MDSHYMVAPNADNPKSWTSPVDYSKGSVHIALDVKTKPAGDTPTQFHRSGEVITTRPHRDTGIPSSVRTNRRYLRVIGNNARRLLPRRRGRSRHQIDAERNWNDADQVA